MKKIAIILLILLSPVLLFADSIKYTEAVYPTYNPVFSTTKEFSFSPLTFGLGFNTSTYYLDNKDNGFGIGAKIDIGFDAENDNKTAFQILLGGTYQYTINKNIMLSTTIGPSIGIFSNIDHQVDDTAVNFGLGLDLELLFHPTPLFGFTLGATGYILPLGTHLNSQIKTPQMYSLATYVGFVFAFGSKNEDSYFIPPFTPIDLIYLNYLL